MREVYGDTGENHDCLVSFVRTQGIELVYTEKIQPALGVSYGGRIAILRDYRDERASWPPFCCRLPG
jgi:hypothetical protein